MECLSLLPLAEAEAVAVDATALEAMAEQEALTELLLPAELAEEMLLRAVRRTVRQE